MMNKFNEYYIELMGLLKEDPDTVQGELNNKKIYLNYEDFDAIAFFELYGHIIYATKSGYGHGQVFKFVLNDDAGRYNAYPVLTSESIDKIKESSKQKSVYDLSPLTGRIWKNVKVISFWETKPNIEKYLPLIFEFLKHIKQNPAKYVYQFGESENLIPYNQLNKTLKATISQSEIDKKRAEHAKSPLLKKSELTKYYKGLSVPGMPGRKKWAMSSESIVGESSNLVDSIPTTKDLSVDVSNVLFHHGNDSVLDTLKVIHGSGFGNLYGPAIYLAPNDSKNKGWGKYKYHVTVKPNTQLLNGDYKATKNELYDIFENATENFRKWIDNNLSKYSYPQGIKIKDLLREAVRAKVELNTIGWDGVVDFGLAVAIFNDSVINTVVPIN